MLGIREDRLSIYLNDHLAGSTAGLQLARSIARSHPELRELAAEIEEDRETLLDLMRRLGIGEDRVKVAIGWVAEKAGRLKLSGDLVGDTPLNRLEKLEAMSLGVEGKLGMWEALQRTHDGDPRLGPISLERLVERPRAQREQLERERLRVAERAF